MHQRMTAGEGTRKFAGIKHLVLITESNMEIGGWLCLLLGIVGVIRSSRML